ncbi:MAG: GNAT family N-acetyltransferase [Paracoccaceae bacterium]
MTAQDKPTLIGPRVTLRAARDTDVQGRLELGNTPEIQAMFGADPKQLREITRDAAKAWVRNQMDEPHAWVIEVQTRLIGALRIHSINRADARASVAIGILDAHLLGQGYGTEAMQLLAKHAFENIGLHRLSCRVLAFNTRAIAAYEKVGFVQEGRERESACIGDAWQDDIILGLLPSDLKPIP